MQKTGKDGNKKDININKTDKYEKNWTSMLWRSTKHINIIKYKTLNMTEHKTDIPNTKNWTWGSINQTWILLNTKNWTWQNTDSEDY